MTVAVRESVLRRGLAGRATSICTGRTRRPAVRGAAPRYLHCRRHRGHVPLPRQPGTAMLAPGAILLGNARHLLRMRSRARRRRPLHLVPLRAGAHGDTCCADVPGARRLAFAGAAAAAVPAARAAGCQRGSRARVGRGRGASRKSRWAWPARRRPALAGARQAKAADQNRRAADRRGRAAHRGLGRDSDQSRRSGRRRPGSAPIISCAPSGASPA